MKEYTVVTNIQFTEIIYSEDYFDKIELKSCKAFPREVE